MHPQDTLRATAEVAAKRPISGAGPGLFEAGIVEVEGLGGAPTVRRGRSPGWIIPRGAVGGAAGERGARHRLGPGAR